MCMDNYFPKISQKISGSQEDSHISIYGCPHSIFGRRGHEDTQILLPWGHYLNITKSLNDSSILITVLTVLNQVYIFNSVKHEMPTFRVEFISLCF